jgi:glycerophosphoryl diester phosphodiesterase
VLDFAAPAGVALLIELKTPGPAVTYQRVDGAVTPVPGARYPGLEQKVLAGIAAAEVSDRAMLMAFNPAVVAEIRRLAPRQPTALLVECDPSDGERRRGVDAVDWATRAGVTFLGLHRELCDAAVVAAARANGIGVGVFTVNDEEEMRRLAELGVDVVITDRADLARRFEPGTQ